MARTVNTFPATLLALLALTGTIAAAPSAAIAVGLIHACVNNSSGTIHVVGETSTCANNEVRLVWANQDQVAALQQAVAALQARVAGLRSLTSPNGQYMIEVADDGIVLQGPGVSIQLDAGSPANPTPTVTITGTDVDVIADLNTSVKSGSSTTIDSGVDSTIKSSGTIHVQGSGAVTIQGSTVTIN